VLVSTAVPQIYKSYSVQKLVKLQSFPSGLTFNNADKRFIYRNADGFRFIKFKNIPLLPFSNCMSFNVSSNDQI